MKDVLTGLLTGKDNQTHDIGRWGMAFGMITLAIMQGFALWRGQQFDVMTYAGAVATLSVGGAGGIRLAAPTQPGT